MSRFQARWIVGKTVQSVEVTRLPSILGGGENHIERITFTDGSAIVFMGEETEDEPLVIPLYRPAKK